MSVTVLSWPTISELRTADYSYFGQLAGYLEKISPQAQTALRDLAEDVKRPGGVDWEGDAGDAAISQAHADLIKARPIIWSWDEVAVSARPWQDELEAGTRTALDAVDDAERDGFIVNQDYSVSDTRESTSSAQLAQRQAQAAAHANYIRHHVAILVGNESRINGELNAMTAGWGTLNFPKSSGGAQAQPVDRTFKRGPDHPSPPPPGYPQGPAAGRGLPPKGVHPPVQGPLTVGPASKPSEQAQGGQSLWDKSGGEWRYDPRYDKYHYPHWDYNSHAAPNSRWNNIGIDDLPTHTEAAAPPRSGSIGTPPAGPVPGSGPATAEPAPPPVEPPAAAPPAKLEPLPPPEVIGGGGGETGGGGGGGIPGLGIGGMHVPTEEVD